MLSIQNIYSCTSEDTEFRLHLTSASDMRRIDNLIFLEKVVVRLLHIDFLERSRIAASIQTAPPRAVAPPPRILACSTTYIYSHMAYWKLTSIPPACYFPSIEQVLVSNLRWNVSTCQLEVRDFSRGFQLLGAFLTALLCKNPAGVYVYLSFLWTESRRMKSLVV